MNLKPNPKVNQYLDLNSKQNRESNSIKKSMAIWHRHKIRNWIRSRIKKKKNNNQNCNRITVIRNMHPKLNKRPKKENQNQQSNQTPNRNSKVNAKDRSCISLRNLNKKSCHKPNLKANQEPHLYRSMNLKVNLNRNPKLETES